MESTWTSGRRTLVVAVCLFASAVIVAYWVLWFADRGVLASSGERSYLDFENAFPLADGWLTVCLLATAFACLRRAGSVGFWLVASGAAALYLFGMDALYDVEHGIWFHGGAGGLVEAVINVLTLAMGTLFMLLGRRALHPR